MKILFKVSTASKNVATFSLTKTKGSAARLFSSCFRWFRPLFKVKNLKKKKKKKKKKRKKKKKLA